MSGMERRLKRLEGPGAVDGVAPAWCAESARQEAELGIIDPEEQESRAKQIAGQFRSAADYQREQQRKHLEFITRGEGK